MIATIALSYYVVSREAASTGYSYYNLMHTHHSDEAAATLSARSAIGGGMWTVSFAYYALFIHILVSIFPVRACWSMFTITRALKKNQKSKALRDIKLSHRRRGSSTSLSSSETLTSSRDGSVLSSATSSEAGDLEPEQYTDVDSTAIDNIVHVVVIPNYKEEVDTLRETLDVLASHPQARHSYDVSISSSHKAKPSAFDGRRSQPVLRTRAAFESGCFRLGPHATQSARVLCLFKSAANFGQTRFISAWNSASTTRSSRQ